MKLKLFVAITILVTASIAAFAQDNQAPKPTIEEAQKLVQTISGDKAKLKVYCEIGKLQEEMAKAEEKNDAKALEALGTKVDSLEQQVGPDYIRVMDGLDEVDPDSAEGQKFAAIFDTLHKQCK
jgi:Skp family chaperone for outer membrane proteins